MAFHNPYHFVPTNKPGAESLEKKWLSKDQFENNEHNGTHDRYHPQTHSGRIVCKLTTKSPIFVGAKRRDGDAGHPAEADHFELGSQPAIPATSLRGVISSIAEAASGSALRVLENSSLSYRKDWKESLSALGMVFVEQNEAGETVYRLQPIALPTLAGKERNGRFSINHRFSCYHKMFCHDGENGLLQPRLKVYTPGNTTVRDPNDNRRSLPFMTYMADKPEYFYMELRRDRQFTADLQLADTRQVKIKLSNKKDRDDYIIGQRAVGGNRSPIYHEDDPRVDKTTMVRGILRVLSGGRRSDMPPSKKHELFIPYPEEAVNWRKFPLPNNVVTNFHTLADERTKAEKEKCLPFEPLGTLRNTSTDPDDRKFRLKTGDIVYFGVDDPGKIDEIAMSSIWRGGPLENGTLTGVHDFFKAIDPELLPYTKERSYLSPAEMVFGFVEECIGGKAEEETGESFAFKSRVRFSHGLPEMNGDKNPLYLDPVILKILAAPKPPSPNFYFKRKDSSTSEHIQKSEIKVGDFHPQGRKLYVHHRAFEIKNVNNPPWKTIHETKHLKQKVRIRPVDHGKEFWFHVDFENLDEYQLGMLCYGLQPSPDFHHKIGMGKSLGLGSVCIEPTVLALVDRNERYCEEDPFEPDQNRYHQSWRNDKLVDELPQEYIREREAKSTPKIDFQRLRDDFAEHVEPDVKRALDLLGDLQSAQSKVHTPLAENQADIEDETFKWFVNNDDKGKNGVKRQALAPIVPGTKQLQQFDGN
ncbi:MAG: TIGR03986 family CRISPR-associated RAMP protein [Desulfobulbaceae bacterium]|nr:TIGR03986 family CRISPR-associated RAMP protein [Desulfobulbaceae bacterium]